MGKQSRYEFATQIYARHNSTLSIGNCYVHGDNYQSKYLPEINYLHRRRCFDSSVTYDKSHWNAMTLRCVCLSQVCSIRVHSKFRIERDRNVSLRSLWECDRCSIRSGNRQRLVSSQEITTDNSYSSVQPSSFGRLRRRATGQRTLKLRDIVNGLSYRDIQKPKWSEFWIPSEDDVFQISTSEGDN